jgi:DNA polymerase III subunit gamma/tau
MVQSRGRGRVRVLCTGRYRTSSGPEGSSDKASASGAADQPEPFLGLCPVPPITAMAYQVLARKWRPQDFSSVIGQENIVTALRNGLGEGRIAQAYLFSGIRGVGKTSVARVLAKALNCENGPASDPCNECQTCLEITAGSDLDVIEVDAATYSKVEQVRELTESLKYGPARDRYKVVVVDEIHRLSRQAFDALLKIVEEPPPHLVFIFATTESDAVPATVLSRCQEFHFRRVQPVVLTQHLRALAEKENIKASDMALRLIARASEGSVRDAVALLDQMATYGSGEISDEDAANVLGGVDRSIHHGLLSSILAGSSSDIAGVVAKVEEQGWDPRHVFAEFLAYCRDALHLSLGVDADTVELPEDETERLAALAREAGYENLLRLLHQLLASEATVLRSDSGILAAEIAWLRAAELPKLTQIEDLLAGRPRPPATKEPVEAKQEAQSSSAPPSVETETASSGSESPRGADEPKEPKGEDESRIGDGSAATASTAPDGCADNRELLERLIEEISRRRQSLAAHIGGIENLALSEGELQISEDPADNKWLQKALGRGKNRAILEESLAAVLGDGARWKLVEVEKSPAPDIPAEEKKASDPLLSHSRVQTALDIFGGTAYTAKREET